MIKVGIKLQNNKERDPEYTKSKQTDGIGKRWAGHFW